MLRNRDSNMFLNYVLCQEGIRGNVDISSRIIHSQQIAQGSRLDGTGERFLRAHRIWNWVEPRIGQDASVKRNILCRFQKSNIDSSIVQL